MRTPEEAAREFSSAWSVENMRRRPGNLDYYTTFINELAALIESECTAVALEAARVENEACAKLCDDTAITLRALESIYADDGDKNAKAFTAGQAEVAEHRAEAIRSRSRYIDGKPYGRRARDKQLAEQISGESHDPAL